MLLVVITTVVMACFTGLRFWITWHDFNQDIDAKFERITARISATVNPTIWDIYQKSLNRTYSKDVAAAILDAELADPYLIAIKVHGNFGHLFMGKVKVSEDEIVSIDTKQHAELLETADSHQLYPIRFKQMTIGNVEVYFTKKPLREQLVQNLVLEIAEAVFVGLIVILFLFYALRKSLVQPLLALQTAKHAIESMTDSVVIMAPDGQVIEANNAFLEQSGYELPEIDYKIPDLFRKTPDNPDPISEIWDQVDTEGHWIGEVETVRKNGTSYPAMLSITTVYNEAGTAINRVMVIRDNTKDHQNRQIEHQLHHAQRMETVGALAGGIAHDINNVLTPIMGWAEVLADELSKKDASRHGAEQILKGALRARGMIDQIMDFSRMNKSSKPRLVDLKEIITGSVGFIRATFPAAITIEIDLANDDMDVFGDPGKIEQVLINMYTNAMHAMEHGGGILRITADIDPVSPDLWEDDSSAEPAPFIHLTISDTGIGIPEDVRTQIFEPYFSTKGSGKGNGFGLSTSLGIVNMMGGMVTVSSETGKGSVFHIWLPVADDAEPRIHKNRMEIVQAIGGEDKQKLRDQMYGKRIMLVDDEKDNLTLGENMLGRFGCKTSSFNNSEKAQEAFLRSPHKFDLLITDQSMPDLQGHELVAAVRVLRPNLPVIVMTGQNIYETEKKFADLGNITFIRKPFEMSELETALQQVVNQFSQNAKNTPQTELI